jgi:hypothetical protein
LGSNTGPLPDDNISNTGSTLVVLPYDEARDLDDVARMDTEGKDRVAVVSACSTLYLRAVFGGKRRALMQATLIQRHGLSFVCREAAASAGAAPGKLLGFTAVRRSGDGYGIGPLYADSAAVGHALLQAVRGAVPTGASISALTPNYNAAAVELFQGRHGFKQWYQMTKMLKGGTQAADNRVYCVASAYMG